MRSVGLKTLKNKLSEYVRLAASGETVQVTDRNRVVAELVPPRTKKPMTPEERWQEMIREGIITPARNRTGKLPPPLPAVMTFEELMRELDEDRADRDLP